MKKNKFKDAISNNSYSFLAFVAAAFVMLIVYYCFSVYPFGDYTVLRMDLYHQYGPLFSELYDRIAQGKSLVYSWNSGLGGSFLGNFSNYLASPLALVMLLLGHENMPEAISVMVLLKACFAAAFFSYYLRKTTGKQNFSTSAFGVLYAFCGFFIAYYWNIMWIDAMALFPLVMLGIEFIIKRGHARLYLFSLALVMISNYYMAYIICLFSVIYFVVFYLANYKLSEKFEVRYFVNAQGQRVKALANRRDKESADRPFINSRFINSGLRFAAASLGAAGIAAFLLLPTYHILQSCSATSGTFPDEVKTYFKIFDFLANHLSSVNPTIRSSGEDVLPNVYCGMISVMLAPLYLYSKSYTKREKTCYVVLLAILFVSFNVNSFNYIWHGFHFPNDLPYRLSYIYSFVLLVMAYKALIHAKDYTPKMLLTTGIGTLAFIMLAQKIGSKNVTEDTVIMSIIFAVFYTIVMLLLQSGKYQRSAIALLLFCGVVSEAAIGNTSHYVMQQQKKFYATDYPAFQTLKETLDEREGSSFYRMDLTDLRARMDPSWYNYNGLSTFSSMAYESTSNLIHYLGVDGNVINSYTNNGYQTPVFNMMTSLKYIVDNTTDTPVPSQELYTYTTSSDKFTAYKNNYCLNLGYCVDKSVIGWDYTNSNPFDVQNDYFKRATGIENVFTQIPIDYFTYDNISEMSLGYETGNLTFFRENADYDASFTACYEVGESRNYYLYMDSDNIEDVVISYNYGGEEEASGSLDNSEEDDGALGVISNEDDTGVGEIKLADEIAASNGVSCDYTHNFSSEHLVYIGYVEEGTTIYVNVPIADGASGYVDMYMCSMDLDKFSKGFSILEQGQLNIDSFEETDIKGTATAAKDSLFYTSIPYDESWQVYVDGELVGIEEMQECKIGNGFLGFYLPEGKHDIELKYEARGLKTGMLISGATILLLVLIFIVLKKRGIFAKLIAGYSDKCMVDIITVEEPIEEDDFAAVSPQELEQPQPTNEDIAQVEEETEIIPDESAEPVRNEADHNSEEE